MNLVAICNWTNIMANFLKRLSWKGAWCWNYPLNSSVPILISLELFNPPFSLYCLQYIKCKCLLSLCFWAVQLSFKCSIELRNESGFLFEVFSISEHLWGVVLKPGLLSFSDASCQDLGVKDYAHFALPSLKSLLKSLWNWVFLFYADLSLLF